ncbi:MAG: hypothetical protein ACI3XI_00505 [Eubacteriales bacterium]
MLYVIFSNCSRRPKAAPSAQCAPKRSPYGSRQAPNPDTGLGIGAFSTTLLCKVVEKRLCHGADNA